MIVNVMFAESDCTLDVVFRESKCVFSAVFGELQEITSSAIPKDYGKTTYTQDKIIIVS